MYVCMYVCNVCIAIPSFRLLLRFLLRCAQLAAILHTHASTHTYATHHRVARHSSNMADAPKRNYISVVLGTMTFGWSNASTTCDDEKSAEMTRAFLANPQHDEIDTAFLVRDRNRARRCMTVTVTVFPAAVGEPTYCLR
jgi:hypothetical protein